jgi:hypothetical protein
MTAVSLYLLRLTRRFQVVVERSTARRFCSAPGGGDMVCEAAHPPSRRRASDAFSPFLPPQRWGAGRVSIDYRLLVVINTLLPPLLATTIYLLTGSLRGFRTTNGIIVSVYLTSYRTSSKPHGKAREKEQTRSVEHIRQFHLLLPAFTV